MRSSKKKKSIWPKILIGTAVFLAVGATAGYFTLRHMNRTRNAAWRTDGLAAAAAGDNEKAAALLGRYIRVDPRDLDVLEAYIAIREKVESPNGQHISDTVAALKAVLGIAPDRLDDREHLLRLYARLQRRPEALDTASAVLAQIDSELKTETDPAKRGKLADIKAECLGIKANVLLGDLKTRDALNVCEEWLKAAPADLSPQMMRIDLRVRLGQPLDSVIADAQKAVTSKPQDPAAELLLGYALLHAGDTRRQEATMWLRSAAKDADPRHPKPADIVKIIVNQFNAIGVAADAIAVSEDLVARGAGADVRHPLACRYWEQGQWQKCVDMLADVNPADAKADPELLALKLIAYSNLSKHDDVAACRTALGQMKNSTAAAWLTLVPRLTTATDVDDKKVVEACRQALALNAADPYLNYYLGDAYARLNEVDFAIDAWKQSSAYGPTWSVPTARLVEALIHKGKPDLALIFADGAARRNPKSASAVIALARAWSVGLDTGQVAEADKLLALVTDIQTQLPGEEQTLLIRVELLARSGKTADAVAAARAAISAKDAPAQQFFINLAAVSRRQNLGLEEEIFSAAEKAHGLTPENAFARAVNQFLGGNPANGLKTLDDLSARKDRIGDAVIWKLARARFLDMTFNSNDRAAIDAAAAAWKSLGNEFPDNLTVQTAITSANAAVGNWDLMSQAVDRLHAIGGDKGLQWRLAQGRMYIQCARNEDDYVKGSLALSSLVKDVPGLAEAHVLLARALVHLNRIDGAIDHLQTASQLDPNSVPIALNFATLLQTRGEFDRVQVELDRILPRVHSQDDVRVTAALYAGANAPEKGAALLEKYPGEGPANSDLLRAMIYRRQGQYDKAIALVETLLKKPDLPTVQFAAGLYLGVGRKADAEKTLALLDALKLAPAIKEMIWGAYHLQIGNYPEAVRQYQAATRIAPGNLATWRTLAAVDMLLGRRDDAITVLRDAAKALPEDKEIAAELAQADLLREALNDQGLISVALIYHRSPLAGDAALEMMRLVTDARRANDMPRLAAQLQQFIERHTDFMPAYIRLAQCFLEMGRNHDAMIAAQRAMTVFANDPEPARIATQVAAAAQNWTEMRVCAESWKKRAQDPNADVALARALSGLGQYAAARDQVQPYIAHAKANPDQFAGVLSAYASALVNLGKDKDAQDLLWPLAQKETFWRGLWVDTSLTFKDPRQTTAWLDKLEGITPADAMTERLAIAEALDVLGAREKDQKLVEKSSQMLYQLAQLAPKSAVVQLTAAAHAERLGDVKTAEVYYRKVLALDAGNWVANNNLAMIILRGSGNADEAVKYAKLAIVAHPQSANTYDTLAYAQGKAGDPKSAIESMHSALKISPDNIAYKIRLTKYLLNAGLDNEAKAVYGEIDQNDRAQTGLDSETRQTLEDIRKRVNM
ncbi:MAG TPA: tetratricopeptide repeat protein [Phycisphaerae bacterium]|nr:tetratricopeptide repeat protein [Phycisphaerae bacterium]